METKFYLVQRSIAKNDKGSGRDLVLWATNFEETANALLQAVSAKFSELEAEELLVSKSLVVCRDTEIGSGFLYLWTRDFISFRNATTFTTIEGEEHIAQLLVDNLKWPAEVARRWAFCFYTEQDLTRKELQALLRAKIPLNAIIPSPDEDAMTFFAANASPAVAPVLQRELDLLWEEKELLEDALNNALKVTVDVDPDDPEDPSVIAGVLRILDWRVWQCISTAKGILETVEHADPPFHPYILAVVSTFEMIYTDRLENLNKRWQTRQMPATDEEQGEQFRCSENLINMLESLKDNLPSGDVERIPDFQTGEGYLLRVVDAVLAAKPSNEDDTDVASPRSGAATPEVAIGIAVDRADPLPENTVDREPLNEKDRQAAAYITEKPGQSKEDVAKHVHLAPKSFDHNWRRLRTHGFKTGPTGRGCYPPGHDFHWPLAG